MELGDLVVLEYASNNCYVHVRDAKQVAENEGLVIDLEKRSWSYRRWKGIKIGDSRSAFDGSGMKNKYGIIGVYDRNNTQHLDMLASATREFTQEDRPYSVD
jgi:hypothetical protein